MSKQDRQGVRRASELERKYGFGQKFSQQSAKNAEMSKQMAGNEAASNAAFAQIAANMEALEGRINETIAALEERVVLLEETVAAQGETITALEERLSALE